jgi:hypothetical protein
MLILFCLIFYTILLTYWLHGAQSFWATNRFSASQEIPPFCGNQSFITACTSACHLPLSWAHTSGSIQVWGTSLYFITSYLFMVRSCSHLTQPLSWSTNPCWLSATAYLIYSQLPSILEAIPASSTWGHAMPWWQVTTYLGQIAYYDGFNIRNDSEDELSVCIINIWAFFLLDMFHS